MSQSAIGNRESAIANRSLIVGTAGHIDHGKSALVRALTGTDPDRLPEEKRRGITIDLGFADLQLGTLRLGFVDVPGHERFIKNMLAGAHGIDVVALVVAADEGVMPQTREHFDICRLLGVQHGFVVITKSDLVEPDMLSLVEDETKQLIAGSFLEESPIVSVSSKTGAGLDELKTAMVEVAQKTPARPSDQVTRLPVDRVFSMKGFGAVVTGTLISGHIAEGDELELLPSGAIVRVRGTQVHGQVVATAQAGQRTAVNISGVDLRQIDRGMVLAPPKRLRPTQILDVRVSVLPTASRVLRSRARVRVHIGAAEVLGRIRVLDPEGGIGAGAQGLVQLRLESPVVAVHNDRFVIRTYSPQETLAGGVVLHPFASKHRGKDLRHARQLLERLSEGEPASKFVALVQFAGQTGIRLSDLAAATGWTDELLLAVAERVRSDTNLTDAGGVFISSHHFDNYSRRVTEELESFHKREPLSRGLLRETLREKVFAHSAPEIFSSVLAKLEMEGSLVSEKDTVRLASHRVDLSEQDRDLRERLQRECENAGVEAPSIDELMTRVGVTPRERQHARKVLQLLIDAGSIVRIQGEMVIDVRIVDELKRKLLVHGEATEPNRLIDVPTFKELAGVSRKYAIPLLEYFDRQRVTRRAGDKRVILK
jgi:selenocysteine-specific elongation factor